MKTIKILGTGCPKCKALEKATRDAIQQTGIDADVIKVEDITKIMEYGIMRTPGLVINEKIVSSGRVPGIEEIKNMININ
ncbi:MAG: TM0996/MTH895 family glutaredoxin-like protein [Cyclobacteriaceae bacterium]|nr:TM0996/MTH895 family glutaredoxin-like protein [Cyclobacteriaceae bacterium]